MGGSTLKEKRTTIFTFIEQCDEYNIASAIDSDTPVNSAFIRVIDREMISQSVLPTHHASIFPAKSTRVVKMAARIEAGASTFIRASRGAESHPNQLKVGLFKTVDYHPYTKYRIT